MRPGLSKLVVRVFFPGLLLIHVTKAGKATQKLMETMEILGERAGKQLALGQGGLSGEDAVLPSPWQVTPLGSTDPQFSHLRNGVSHLGPRNCHGEGGGLWSCWPGFWSADLPMCSEPFTKLTASSSARWGWGKSVSIAGSHCWAQLTMR